MPFVALKAWLDRDEEVVLFVEAKSNESPWRTDVLVDVRRREDEDQTVVGRCGRRAELGKRGVEEGMRNRQTCERSPENYNIERLVLSARDIGCSRSRPRVTYLRRKIDCRKDAVVWTLSCCSRAQKSFMLRVIRVARWR